MRRDRPAADDANEAPSLRRPQRVPETRVLISSESIPVVYGKRRSDRTRGRAKEFMTNETFALDLRGTACGARDTCLVRRFLSLYICDAFEINRCRDSCVYGPATPVRVMTTPPRRRTRRRSPSPPPPSPPLSRQHERSDRCLRALSHARDNDITAEDVNTGSFVE